MTHSWRAGASDAVSSHQPLSADAQAALGVVPCGLLCTDGSGTIVRVNATFSRWIGQPEVALIGRRLPDLLTIGGRIFHQTHLAPLLAMQGSISEVKLELVGDAGQTIPVVVNAQRRRTPDGPITDVAMFVARDRDMYERELLHSRRRLEKLVQEAQQHHEEAKEIGRAHV